MRLLVRFALIACVVVVIVVWFSVSKAINSSERNDPESDETVRILLMSEQQSQQFQQISVPQITLNVAVVLIISLLSVALLITGIIVVAVTLDPTMADNSNESDEDYYETFIDSSRKNSPLIHNKIGLLWQHGISSSTGRLLPQLDTLSRLQPLSDVTIA